MVRLWDIFRVFSKVGAVTIGGGYAMVSVIMDETVKRGWIPEDEFPDILALAQSAPGLLAVNISIFAGYRIRGVKGSIAATVGCCMPPFLIILAIAMFFTGYQDNPVVMRIFKGIRPAVVALIAVPMIKMARNADRKWWHWLLTAVSMCLVAFMRMSPIYILLVTMIVSLAVILYRERRGEGHR